MKFCDLTQSYAPTGGGVRTYLHAKREYLCRRTDDEHLLIVPGAEDSVRREGRTTTYTVRSPLVPGSHAYRLLLRSGEVLRILDAERPDLIASYCTYNLPWTALHHRKRHPETPVVGFYMTDVAQAYVEEPLARYLGAAVGRGAGALAERYVRALFRRFDARVAISPALAERLRAMGVPDVHCIPLGVDLERFHPGRRDDALRRELGVEADEPLLVYAGRLDAEKRAEMVARAWERLPAGFRGALVLVGEGPLRPELERRAAADRRMRVLPFQSDREALARLLASADLYVSAMPFETFGLSVVEAQACGLPVLGVRGGAMVDRVPEGAGVGALGPVDDADAMAAHILRLTDDAAELAAMGRRARALVEAEFSWDRTFEQLFALYDRLLGTVEAPLAQ